MQMAGIIHLIRPMDLGDIPQVMEIEQEAFPTQWPRTSFKRELQNQLSRYLVAEEVRQPSATEEPETRLPPEFAELGREPREARGRFGRFLLDLQQIAHGEESTLLPPEQRSQLVVGFIGVWLVSQEAHVVSIAVRESHRGLGIGEILLIAALELALANGQPEITLECRASNTVAISLYQKYGFQQVGLRSRYYTDNQEDAYVFAIDTLRTPTFRERFQQLRQEHRGRWGDYEMHL